MDLMAEHLAQTSPPEKDWTISKDLPQGGYALWRLDAKVAGIGVSGDLLVHNIDIKS